MTVYRCMHMYQSQQQFVTYFVMSAYLSYVEPQVLERRKWRSRLQLRLRLPARSM